MCGAAQSQWNSSSSPANPSHLESTFLLLRFSRDWLLRIGRNRYLVVTWYSIQKSPGLTFYLHTKHPKLLMKALRKRTAGLRGNSRTKRKIEQWHRGNTRVWLEGKGLCSQQTSTFSNSASLLTACASFQFCASQEDLMPLHLHHQKTDLEIANLTLLWQFLPSCTGISCLIFAIIFEASS